MKTENKNNSENTKLGNISKLSLIAVVRELTTRDFNPKSRDLENDNRLGIRFSMINKIGKHIEIYNRDSYWQILHYGFSEKNHPLVFDVIFKEDVSKYGAFLNAILTK